ncbi:MAG: SLBB domain-containing protein [Synergistaceae bacterium]|nr:SLBB domain-containing protein [Synergistaceae bacterium]
MGLLDSIKDAGIVGAGGAGFPTHVKLDCRVEYMLVNAAECEPLLATDKHIMNSHPDEVLEGLRAVAEHVGAGHTFIAVKAVNEKETFSMKDAIGRSGFRAEVFPLDNYYPAGDEQMIVYDITGRTVPPSGIPLEVGAVVSNVATMWNVSEALRGRPVTHKFLTVTGEVARPAVLKVPIGTPFTDCIAFCGGVRTEPFKIIDGGPMMGAVSDGSDVNSKYVTKTTSGIIVIPAAGNFDSRTHDTAIRKILNRAKSACIQCSFCTDLCPRRLIGHKLRPNMVMRCMSAMDFESPIPDSPILEEALICCECGVCETYACPMSLSPRQVNKYIKGRYAGRKYKRPDEPLIPVPAREYRKIAPSRIMARMGMYDMYGNKVRDFAEFTPARVRIPLKQHIGAPAKPLVEAGDRVSAGQRIADADGHVSANIHASVDGVVTEVGSAIEIKADA